MNHILNMSCILFITDLQTNLDLYSPPNFDSSLPFPCKLSTLVNYVQLLFVLVLSKLYIY